MDGGVAVPAATQGAGDAGGGTHGSALDFQLPEHGLLPPTAVGNWVTPACIGIATDINPPPAPGAQAPTPAGPVQADPVQRRYAPASPISAPIERSEEWPAIEAAAVECPPVPIAPAVAIAAACKDRGAVKPARAISELRLQDRFLPNESRTPGGSNGYRANGYFGNGRT
jgi:hypothetical protein